MSPAGRRKAVKALQARLGYSERRICRVIGQARSTQRYVLEVGEADRRLIAEMRRSAAERPGSPWENGYVESFNGKLRDECLDGELFLSLAEANYVVDRWRLDYNHHRPHSALDWM